MSGGRGYEGGRTRMVSAFMWYYNITHLEDYNLWHVYLYYNM